MDSNTTESAPVFKEHTVAFDCATLLQPVGLHAWNEPERKSLKYLIGHKNSSSKMAGRVLKTDGSEGQAAEQKVRFLVGPERKLLVGKKSRMAAVSPVFEAMFRGPWMEEKAIEIPDVQPDALKVLLR